MTTTEHPGLFIRRHVLPATMSVTKAAEKLGVSRPALSNLLNGKVSLSPAMALRLEMVFGAKKDELLRMQAEFDDPRVRLEAGSIPVRPYVASFLDITAAQIADWAGRETSRALLPVFLRRLILTTAKLLEKVDFPGYDNAQRRGWDGQVRSPSATPWVPAGLSGWEFGCDQDPKRKADHDYEARTGSVPISDRKETTFVFVSPRNWAGKESWAETKRREGHWKDVRAFDASDLEQWLEQSISVQSWMSERLGTASPDLLTLEECWDRWANVTEPRLSKALFSGTVELHAKTLKDWLAKPPADPLVITADSSEEALAFLDCALQHVSDESVPAYERAVVLKSGPALEKAVRATNDFVAVIASRDAELASAGIHRTQHTIVIDQGSLHKDADIALTLVDDKSFEAGLSEMGYQHSDVANLARECGQSLTVLRRRLARVPAIKSPPWAADSVVGRKLIPLLLAGAWDSQSKADQQIVSFLAGVEYGDVEVAVAELRRSEQSPLWAVGRHRGVVSKIDALYATYGLVTIDDLEGFLTRARVVLSESDPALELPEDKRWMAAVYEKTRNHSLVLRNAICDSLVLLAVHGNNLLNQQLGVDVEARVSGLMRELLSPLSDSQLRSQQDDLPAYAEAAPDTFLEIVEADLNKDRPSIFGLMQPADTAPFGGGCPRTGLLWALENLAWKSTRLARVALILAKLAETRINDNWANTPEASLVSVFRSWMPQTAATIEERGAVLAIVCKRLPDVGWRLCMSELDTHNRIGHYSHRPRWRRDALGFGEPVKTWDEMMPFKVRALNLAIDWQKHTSQTLGDLVNVMLSLPDDRQEAIWEKVREWAAKDPSEEDKAYLKERIRRSALTRRRGKAKKVPAHSRDAARQMLLMLEPKDLVVRHSWLFEKHWVEESQEDSENEKFDHREHEKNVHNARRTALAEVWASIGFEGIKRLCQIGETSRIIGWILADGVLSIDEMETVVLELVDQATGASWSDACLNGLLSKCEDGAREELIRRVAGSRAGEVDKLVRVLRMSPFNASTWSLVSKFSEDVRLRYWKEVYATWLHHSPQELRELIDRLLEVDRPRAAFHAVHFVTEELETDVLVRLLREMARSDSEPKHEYHLSTHEIESAFKVLDGRTDVRESDLAELEFAYLAILEDTNRGIPNLGREVSRSPKLFVQALGLVFKRRDGGTDPAEWRVNDEDVTGRATQAYSLLRASKRVPGTGEDGKVNADELKAWIKEVRALSAEYGREEVGDQMIGELLTAASTGSDGIWPNEVVRDVLEEIGTTNIARGFSLRHRNSITGVFRAVNSEEDRALAAKYKDWAKRTAFDWPFTSRILEEVARFFDWEAERHDQDSALNQRIMR